jgi:hypothetical protein
MPGSVQCSCLGLEPEAAAAQEEESWLRLIRHPPRLGGIFSPQRRCNGMRFRGALAAIQFRGHLDGR